MAKSLLLLGSGPSIKLIEDLDLSKFYVVAINHAWLATDEWDQWFHSADFRGKRPKSIKFPKKEVGKYIDALNEYGGHHECGYSTVLNASYYNLHTLKPEKIYYLGCDMNYTPINEEGHTAFYGIGLDIKERKISDPDLMIKKYCKDKDPEKYLEDLYMRFYKFAQNENCEVFNLSNDENTRLPYPKISLDDI